QVFRCCLTQQAIIPDASNPEWMAYFDASSGGLIAHAMPDEASSDPSSGDSPQIAPDSRNPLSAARSSAPSPHRASRHQPFRVLEGRTAYSSRGASTSTAMNVDAVNEDFIDENFMDADSMSADSMNAVSSPHRSSLPFSSRDVARGDRPHISTSGRSPRNRRNSHPLAGSIQLTAQEVEMLQRLAQPDILNNSDGFEASTLLSIERVLRQYAQYHFEKTIRSAELIETCFAAYEL
ncbi:MAG: hypothetical protein VKL39_17355, partial [Leptolyngbyaceae bacterium]|nr:hypothetical protein [Leptolyngbyaceae bacterium]